MEIDLYKAAKTIMTIYTCVWLLVNILGVLLIIDNRGNNTSEQRLIFIVYFINIIIIAFILKVGIS